VALWHSLRALTHPHDDRASCVIMYTTPCFSAGLRGLSVGLPRRKPWKSTKLVAICGCHSWRCRVAGRLMTFISCNITRYKTGVFSRRTPPPPPLQPHQPSVFATIAVASTVSCDINDGRVRFLTKAVVVDFDALHRKMAAKLNFVGMACFFCALTASEL